MHVTPRQVRDSSWLRRAVLASVAALTPVLSFAQTPPTYPRLAAGVIGQPFNYTDPVVQDRIAKLDFVILNAWKGFTTQGVAMPGVIAQLKSKKPSLRVFLYVNNNELDGALGTVDASSDVRNKATEMGWWLYAAGSSGSRVKSTWGDDYWILNTTGFTPRDSSGRRFIEWHADWLAENFYAAIPGVDGFMIDNVFFAPRVDGDWNRDGITDSQSNATVRTWFREGYRDYVARLRSRMPGAMLLGNTADWPQSSALPEFDKLLNGSWMEVLIGESYSVENWGGWPEMMRWYRSTLSMMAEPRYFMFHQLGSSTDYRSFRYGFGSCLLDDGYFAFSDSSTGYGGLPWFDEYDVRLGAALSRPPTAAWSKGVYRRDFENGIVLVNPKGNGSVRVDLEQDFRAIRGTQDAGVNNGQLLRQVSLADRDAIVLLRTVARTRPNPPTGVAVE